MPAENPQQPPILPSEFLPQQALSLLDLTGNPRADVLPLSGKSTEDAELVALAANLYYFAEEFEELNRPVQRTVGREVVELSMYRNASTDMYKTFKISSPNSGTTMIQTYTDKINVSRKSPGDSAPQNALPSDVPSAHWEAIILTRDGISEGNKLTSGSNQPIQNRGRFTLNRLKITRPALIGRPLRIV